MVSGIVVAYLIERDRCHDWVVTTFSDLDTPAITCEAVLTEAAFLVARTRRPATLVLDYAAHSGIQIGLRLDREMTVIRALMQRYENVPMSLAHACLVRLARITRLPISTPRID